MLINALLTATILIGGGISRTALPPLSSAQVQISPQDEVTTLEDITVEGQPVRSAVRSFVESVAAPARGRGPARWNGRLCVGVVNLKAEIAQFLIDRVSAVGAEVGLQPGDPGCKPNLVIMMTGDGGALARGLVETRRREFMTSVSEATAGDRALQDFQLSERAVRWWHVSLPTDSTGLSTVRVPGQTPFQGMANGGQRPSDFGSAASIVTPSRLNSEVKDELQQVLVIVDVNRIGESTFDQIADYISMVGLAQIDPSESTNEFDTILNLFDRATSPPSGLTTFDRAYLYGLYNAPQRISSSRGRISDVAAAMERKLRKDP